MIKPLIILFNTVTVFFFSLLMGDSPVTVTGNIPQSAPVGSEFTAEITVHKGSVSGFAKLQLDVPQGFTVKEQESKGGNFSFTNNIAKIIWTSMPSDADFTVKFTLMADASASGAKTIASKFSYVNNNNKEVAEMTPANITIGDGAVVVAPTPEPTPVNNTQPSSTEPTPVPSTSSQPQSTSSATNSNFDNHAEPNANILCTRSISKGASDKEYNVEVKIKKGSIKGFAKFQEALPNGFSAKGGQLNGSSFSIADGKLKFVWVSLPTDEEMTISYVLENTSSTSENVTLDKGEFSYLENDQSKKIKLANDNLPLSNNTAVARIENSTPTTTTEATVSNNTQPETQVPTSTTTEPVKTEPVAASPEPVTTSNPTPTPNTTSEPLTKKQGNVVYNVQIGAFSNAIQSETLAKKFNISENIKSEMAEGYNKFMVGSFNEYKEARSHRETIKQKGCQGAFVVAYNGAKRITVQEALMITSQKWFK